MQLPGVDDEPRLFVAGPDGTAEEAGAVLTAPAPDQAAGAEDVPPAATGPEDGAVAATAASAAVPAVPGVIVADGGGGRRPVRWMVATLAAVIAALVAVGLVATARPDAVSIERRAAAPAAPVTEAPTTVPEPPEDRSLYAPVDSCPSLYTGQVADHLGVGELLARTSRHPATGQPARWVGPFLFAAPGRSLAKRPPFAIVAALGAPGDEPRTEGPAIDRVGTVQLWSTWDGTTLRSAVRRFDGRRWRLTVDDPGLHVDYYGQAIRFFWDGLQPAMRVAVVTASEGACQASAVGEDLRPLDITVVPA